MHAQSNSTVGASLSLCCTSIVMQGYRSGGGEEGTTINYAFARNNDMTACAQTRVHTSGLGGVESPSPFIRRSKMAVSNFMRVSRAKHYKGKATGRGDDGGAAP